MMISLNPLLPEILPARPYSPVPVPEALALIPPMIYVQEQVQWEYKQLVRDLTTEQVPTEADLNILGADGWELASSVTIMQFVYFYFKRLAT